MVVLIPMALAVIVGIVVGLILQQREATEEAARLHPEPVAKIDIAPPPTPTPGPREQIEEAVAAFKAGDLEGARRLLANMDLVQAAAPSGWELAGLLEEKNGNMTDAMDFYSQGIASAPSEGLYYRRALLRRENEELDLALEDLDQGLAIASTDIVISNERILLLIQMGHKEQAAKELNVLNALRADIRRRIFALSGIALENGEFVKGANLLKLGKKSVAPQIFEQMLKNPVISRHQGQAEILPFYISNVTK